MAEAYEFKRLADVETADDVQDTDTVLIVQGDTVKKTAKSNVGGAGGYIYAPAQEDFGSVVVDSTTYNTISSNYDDLLKTLEAGGSAWLVYNGWSQIIGCWKYLDASDSPTGSTCVFIWTWDDIFCLTNGTYVPNL